MEDLIKALQIFIKYSKEEYPTNCSYDLLFVNVDPKIVSSEDIVALDKLGFFVSQDLADGFSSYKYGSC